MAELKTKATRADVAAFLERIDDATKRDDCRRIAALMAEATGATATLWGDSIVGFGQRRYRYASGREVDWFVIGVGPRKSAIGLYLSTGEPLDAALLLELGRHNRG